MRPERGLERQLPSARSPQQPGRHMDQSAQLAGCRRRRPRLASRRPARDQLFECQRKPGPVGRTAWTSQLYRRQCRRPRLAARRSASHQLSQQAHAGDRFSASCVSSPLPPQNDSGNLAASEPMLGFGISATAASSLVTAAPSALIASSVANVPTSKPELAPGAVSAMQSTWQASCDLSFADEIEWASLSELGPDTLGCTELPFACQAENGGRKLTVGTPLR